MRLELAEVKSSGVVRLFLSSVCQTRSDDHTADLRAKQRLARVLLAAGGIVIAKAVALGVNVVSVPLALRYLGVERYGLWMAITGSVAFLNFADLGVGNGLTNALSHAAGRVNRKAGAVAVSSGFFMLALMGAFLAALFGVAYPLVHWARVFNVASNTAASEAGPAVAAFIAIFIVSLPFGVALRVQLAHQEGFSNSLWQVVGSVVSIVLLICSIRARGSLPALVAALAGGPLVGTIGCFFLQFTLIRPWLAPTIHGADCRVATRLLSAGMAFMVLSSTQALAYQADFLVIARGIGAAAVSTYAVTQKLFSITFLVGFANIPLWPAIGEALARGDYGWAYRAAMKFIGLSVGTTAALSSFLVLYGDAIIRWWGGPSVVPPFSMLCAFGTLSVVTAYVGAVSAFLNNEPTIRRHAALFATCAVFAVAAKPILFRWIGQSGPIWATTLAFTLGYAWPSYRLVMRSLADLKRERENASWTTSRGDGSVVTEPV